MQPLTGTFVATGQSNERSGRRVFLRITGTFVGTVQPQSFQDGAWVSEGSPITSADTSEFAFPIPRPFRLDCTVYTSGTIVFSFEAEG